MSCRVVSCSPFGNLKISFLLTNTSHFLIRIRKFLTTPFPFAMVQMERYVKHSRRLGRSLFSTNITPLLTVKSIIFQILPILLRLHPPIRSLERRLPRVDSLSHSVLHDLRFHGNGIRQYGIGRSVWNGRQRLQ